MLIPMGYHMSKVMHVCYMYAGLDHKRQKKIKFPHALGIVSLFSGL